MWTTWKAARIQRYGRYRSGHGSKKAPSGVRGWDRRGGSARHGPILMTDVPQTA